MQLVTIKKVLPIKKKVLPNMLPFFIKKPFKVVK
jgi:hypothetical protein